MNKLSIFLTLFPLIAFGQPDQTSNTTEIVFSLNTVDPYIPVDNSQFEDKWLSGGDYINTSFAVGLAGKYFFNRTDALRLKVIYTNKNATDYRDITTGSHSVYDEEFRQSLLKISPGFQWTFTENKISLFSGLELPITIIGDVTRNEYVLYETLDGLTKDEYRTTYNTPGGFSIGPGIFFGSNYFLTDDFAIGFDFGTAFQYSSVGGTLSYTSNSTGTNGDATIVSEYKATIKQIKFSPIQAGINLSAKL